MKYNISYNPETSEVSFSEVPSSSEDNVARQTTVEGFKRHARLNFVEDSLDSIEARWIAADHEGRLTLEEEYPWLASYRGVEGAPERPSTEDERMAKLKEQVREFANKNRVIATTTGTVEYNGNVFDADSVSQKNLNDLLTRIANGFTLPQGFTFRSADNQNIPFTAADLNGLSGAMFLKGHAAYLQSWAVKDTLPSVDTLEDVLALLN